MATRQSLYSVQPLWGLIEKDAFKLPDFIEATGIAKLRAVRAPQMPSCKLLRKTRSNTVSESLSTFHQAYEEKESEKSLKQKARAQSRPKTAKMDIDYQVLHDAFFRYRKGPQARALLSSSGLKLCGSALYEGDSSGLP